MEILKIILRSFTKEAKAITVDTSMGTTLCYLGTADLENTVWNIIQWVLYLLAPIMAIILSIKNGFNLLKKKTFSLYYAVYKSFFRTLILSIIFSVIWAITFFIVEGSTEVWSEGYESTTDYENLFLGIGVMIAIIFVFSGLVYLFFIGKNKIFAKLGLSFIFIIPAIVIFCIVIIKNMTPSLRSTLPSDIILNKKEELQNKLMYQGKLPAEEPKKEKKPIDERMGKI